MPVRSFRRHPVCGKKNRAKSGFRVQWPHDFRRNKATEVAFLFRRSDFESFRRRRMKKAIGYNDKNMNYQPIKENREFQRIYTRGKPYVGPELISYVMKNRRNVLRVGITTSKKTGNAVKRNRSRRLIRESFRLLAGSLTPGYDLIFVARAKTPFLKYCDVSRAMRRQLKNAGVLK